MSTNVIDAIKSDARTIREILQKKKYEIDVFQREYLWQRKQMEDLIDDLSRKFLSNYKSPHNRKDVKNYSIYYLGSIIISQKDGKNFIIDGQQRLTSITLLLIYLNNIQLEGEDYNEIKDLIFSKTYGEETFNLLIEDRKECIRALFHKRDYDTQNKSDSVINLYERYGEIDYLFPNELKDKTLPFFIDWLLEKVVFVEIKTS